MDNDDQSNIFSPPETSIETPADNAEPPFYVVSTSKFWILFITTLGMYSVYWFYRNWRLYSYKKSVRIIAPLRAVFHVFFTHSLFKKMDAELDEGEHKHVWKAKSAATSFVILSVLSSILTYRDDNAIYLTGMVLAMISGVFLCQAQVVANIVSNDADGDSNKNITAANIGWILFGLVLWALTLASYFLPPESF